MLLLTCPAQYRRFIESTLALAFAEVRRDITRRADEDPRVRRLATVPDAMLDAHEPGALTVTVAIPNADVLGDDTRVLALTSSR